MLTHLNSFYPSRWRLIRHSPLPGALNMAIDEAILEAVGRAEVMPTLRFYAWLPACLSLGYAQPFSDADLLALRESGWDLVRRPTGGRAILHVDELTYSVIGPESDQRLAGGVLTSYANLSKPLLNGLRNLGVPAEAVEIPGLTSQAGTPAGNSRNHNPVCFEAPSNYEITVGGKKLVGSAQARRKEGVLQHGSLPLHGDLTRIIRALSFSDQEKRQRAAERLLERATTVQMVTGEILDWERAADAFAAAFKETLNLELIPQELSQAETERAQILAEEKFRNPEWTEKI
jgi:lipoate-protein ligase A